MTETAMVKACLPLSFKKIGPFCGHLITDKSKFISLKCESLQREYIYNQPMTQLIK